MSSDQSHPTPPKPLNPPGVILHRIGQACLACRRKKVKCDGSTPCHNCSSRNFTCEYPTSNDNASASRHYAKAFEERCQQLDQFCHRLESISSQLSQSIASLSRLNLNSTNSGADHDELHQAASLLQSLPGHGRKVLRDGSSQPAQPYHSRVADGLTAQDEDESEDDEDEDEDMDDLEDDDDPLKRGSDPPEATDFGSLVSDSYGRLRYLGGANNVLVEAAKQHSPTAYSSSPALSHPAGSGPLNSTNPAPSNKSTTGTTVTGPDLELPIFVHGKRWPEMPYFPDPAVIPRPPQYVSDMLINLYFDQLHYTFPILYKPHFMTRYKQLTASPPSAPATDRKFLSLFFAVCACASGLLPSEGKKTDWPGLPYYQRSLILHYATTGEASIERVQCLGLLAMCSGGWNTLTQSWNFASQAVRAAQDLGMHLSGLTASSDQPSKLVRQQVSRRIWWSVYCLDRVTSTCLGRPMAADDLDCHCVLPLPLSDEELEAASSSSSFASQHPPGSPSPMAGFLALCSLCRIAGRIQRLHAPSRIRQLSRPNPQKQRERFFRSVSSLQASLGRWLERLPPDIRFSDTHSAERRGPNLTMRVVMFIAHAGSMLNLFRLLSGTAPQAALGAQGAESIAHCVNAARSCIEAAELVREVVPPSHLLAFCVHYLTLSGIVLLRMPPEQRQDSLPDVQKCIRFLEGLELSWSGASKGRAIIEHLMKVTSDGEYGAEKEEVPPGFDDFGLSWGQMPGSELFGFETFGTEFFDVPTGT